MKKTTLILSLILLAFTMSAQESKTTISLEPITVPQGINFGTYPQQITALVSGAFVEVNRFTVMPNDNWNIPQSAGGDPYIDVAKTYGVAYMISISLNALSTQNFSSTDANGVIHPAFAAHVSITIKVINTETGAIFNSKTFDMNPFLRMTTPQASLSLALGNFNVALKKWVGAAFPITIGVVRIIEQNDKKGAVKILIKAGSESGVFAGKSKKDKTQFKVVEYVSEDVNGKTMSRTVAIGTAEMEQVDDANFSDCKVTNGGLEIAKKIADGKKLFLITTN